MHLKEVWDGARDFVARNLIWILALNIVQALVVGAIIFAVVVAGNSGDAVEVGRHPCDRECAEGKEPRECRFEFDVELYNTLGKACFECPHNSSDCHLPDCISGDGVERVLVSVNRQMPGPPVAVCAGDRVIVDVRNHLPTESFSVHWHGEHMRDGRQYMDGTPHVTQCPINPGARFKYSFVANTPGTHFWHSHLAFQRADGAFGAFIVREPKQEAIRIGYFFQDTVHMSETIVIFSDPNRDRYDTDRTENFIFPQEWFHMSGRDAFVMHHWDTGKNKADNILINGRGLDFSGSASATSSRLPPAVFEVEEGKRHRFRVASPGFTLCPIQVSVDGHHLEVIGSDGGALEPISVRSFVVHPGERFDFVPVKRTEDKEATHFAMRFAGLFDCAPTKARSAAILKYSGTEGGGNGDDDDSTMWSMVDLLRASDYEEFLDSEGPVLNALNYAPPSEEKDVHPEWIPISKAKARRVERNDEPPKKSPKLVKNATYAENGSLSLDESRRKALEKPQADRVFYLGYDLYPRDNPRFHHADLYSYAAVEGQNKLRTPQMNNVTLRYSTPPLLSQESDVDPELFCPEMTEDYILECGEKGFCSCLYVLEVGLGEVVELVMIDEGFPYDVSHPFHMHGNDFYVVAMERHVRDPENIGPRGEEGNSILRQQVISMDKSGRIRRNLIDPPRKDTASVPDGGFTVLRFLADNPGYWLFHCHMSWHNELGMGVVIKVGQVATDVPPPPKGFPTCNDFF